MSIYLINWLSVTAVVFAALMVLIRFVFYSGRDQGMHLVYFWGGCLFFAIGLFDLTSSVLRASEVHVIQLAVCVTMTLLMLYLFGRQRRHDVVSVHA